MPGILAAVIEAEPDADLDKIEAGLTDGTMQAWRMVGGVAGYLVTHTATVKGTDIPAMWVGWVAGRVLRAPWRIMREVADDLVAVARGWGCKELRIEGRVAGWLRVLPGFEQSGDVLRKVL